MLAGVCVCVAGAPCADRAALAAFSAACRYCEQNPNKDFASCSVAQELTNEEIDAAEAADADGDDGEDDDSSGSEVRGACVAALSTAPGCIDLGPALHARHAGGRARTAGDAARPRPTRLRRAE